MPTSYRPGKCWKTRDWAEAVFSMQAAHNITKASQRNAFERKVSPALDATRAQTGTG